MKIGGLQKFSLLDYPEKICAIVFTLGCNFRCPFCHNPVLVQGSNIAIDEKEFFSFLSSRIGRLDGVCITGGEPLLQNDLIAFLRRIKQLELLVKLDTNGSLPEKLEPILKEGLVDYIAMDIKNSPEKYPETINNQNISINSVRESIQLILKSGIQYEFRTTLVREFHTRDDIHKIGQWLRGSLVYYLQNFRDSGNILDSRTMHSFSEKELVEMKTVAQEYFRSVFIR